MSLNSWIGLYVCLYSSVLCFHHRSFVIKFELRKYESFTFVLLFQDCSVCAILGLFAFPYELWNSLSVSVKVAARTLIRVMLNWGYAE